MTGEPRRITTNKFRAVSSRLARSTADLVCKKGRFWAVFGCFQDDRPESSGRSPLRQASVSDEARSSFMAIGLSNDGKWVFNKACTTPWCHAVVHFQVKTSRFRAVFQDDHPENSGRSLVCAVGDSSQRCSSCTRIRQPNDCKWVMKKASSATRCLPVVHLG